MMGLTNTAALKLKVARAILAVRSSENDSVYEHQVCVMNNLKIVKLNVLSDIVTNNTFKSSFLL